MKIKFDINPNDIRKLEGTVERTRKHVIKTSKRAALMEAYEIMEESLAEVPVDTGALASSHYVEQNADGTVDFGYGKNNVQFNTKHQIPTEDYMMAVHERLDVHHPRGKAKFLEDPVNRHKAKLEKSLFNKMTDLLKGFMGR